LVGGEASLERKKTWSGWGGKPSPEEGEALRKELYHQQNEKAFCSERGEGDSIVLRWGWGLTQKRGISFDPRCRKILVEGEGERGERRNGGGEKKTVSTWPVGEREEGKDSLSASGRRTTTTGSILNRER